MPYKFEREKIKLTGLQDRRKKLTDEQRKEIKKLYGTGFYSLNDLAKKFNVSKKSVLLIVNKNSAEKAKQYGKDHWRERKQTGKEHNKSIKNTRRYKQDLYIKGQLKEED